MARFQAISVYSFSTNVTFYFAKLLGSHALASRLGQTLSMRHDLTVVYGNSSCMLRVADEEEFGVQSMRRRDE